MKEGLQTKDKISVFAKFCMRLEMNFGVFLYLLILLDYIGHFFLNGYHSMYMSDWIFCFFIHGLVCCTSQCMQHEIIHV